MSNPRKKRPEPALPAPALLDSWFVWLALAALVVVPFFLPIAQVLRRDPIIGSLGDHLHIPLLAAVTLLLYWKGPLRGRLMSVVVFAALGGAAIEVLQMLVGRSAEVSDWFLDLMGIGMVVGLVLWRGHGRRMGLVLLAGLLLIVPIQLRTVPLKVQAKMQAAETFPILADFENPTNRRLWVSNHAARLSTVFADSVHGQVLRLEGGPPNRWPGSRYLGFPCDWTDFTTLTFEARVPDADADSLDFQVLVGDFKSRDEGSYLGGAFRTGPGWQTFSLPVDHRTLRRTDRLLDLDDVDVVIFFVNRPQESFQLEIDNLRLR